MGGGCTRDFINNYSTGKLTSSKRSYIHIWYKFHGKVEKTTWEKQNNWTVSF